MLSAAGRLDELWTIRTIWLGIQFGLEFVLRQVVRANSVLSGIRSSTE